MKQSTKLSSRERILAAVRLEQPDMVPVCPRGVQPLTRVYGTERPGWLNMLRASEEIGFDCILNWCPGEKYRADVVVSESVDNDENGTTITTTRLQTPGGELVRRSFKTHGIGPETGPSSLASAMPGGGMVNSEADLEILQSLYAPTYREDVQTFVEMEDETGHRGIVQAEVVNPVNLAARDIGIENFMLLYLDDPDLAKSVLQVYQQVAVWQIEAFLEAGALIIYSDGVWCTSDFWSPQHMADLIAPMIKEQTDMVHQAGAYFHLFMDGNCMAALESVAEMGVDILSPLETPPSGDTNIAEAKRRIGDRVCLWGGVNAYWDIMSATPQRVREAVKNAISAGAPGGGYVLSTADSIYEPCPLENVYEFFAAGREYGRY